MAVIFTWS